VIRQDDPRLADILHQGQRADFDFSKLSHEDQCYLGYACASVHLDPWDESKNILGLDQERYTAFVQSIFDPDSSEIRIPKDGDNDLVLSIDRK
jgi:hypothetical protein